ncbi:MULTISPECIES: AbiV family abortive infection protein [Bradyrhizobium]|uniref:AbiV family abortive infection protein n=1 Tax=Bradyrhizobium TaxID=374 RepID=UPI00155EF7DF|nr:MULTISPECIES: AbiV family abortive infection protein [Bradyrhizobium]MDD1522114.1 hypothetical protein [Bradyrhizobium sp. WBAH30]MDD1541458.1 hypothetical protein [Bradyrhizobium sp. WBAH41]MDD1556918.1 hypothetical protein [Bradyrhizobium sp. WBAH23]MDD1564719.1 hypothetical protein [Bradyrhizobium sp. WBAH33]MDD1589728.1 hypothetical protein [Bradyrhizobium sp. WBAH42]
MDEVVEEIVANARRLLSDAKLLAANGSYPTAVSLSVLSIEESGKACLVRWKRGGYLTRDITRDLRAGHIPKQRILGAYLFAKGVFAATDDVADITPEVVRRASVAGYHAGGLMSFYADSGALDFMKMTGFYLDVDENLEPMRWATSIRLLDAEQHISDAEMAIVMATGEDRLHRAMALAYEQIGQLHKGLNTTGRKFQENLWKTMKELQEGKLE